MDDRLNLVRFWLLLAALTCSSQAALIHRWSFNEASGAAVAGAVLSDSVSSLPLTIKGQGGTFDGTRIVLPGNTGAGEPEATISAYMDLPNGIISSKTDLTLEFWAAPLSGQNWAPLFEFGHWSAAGDGLGQPGEWTGGSTNTPPTAQSQSNITLLLSRGTNLNTQRMGNTIDGTRVDLDSNLATTAGQTYHYVATVQDGVGSFGASGMQVAWYRDGQLVGTRDLAHRLADIQDVNCWFGRLQWTTLGMAHAAYDEARIYDHAFDQNEVDTSLAAGPNATFGPPVLQPDQATIHHHQKVRIPVLENDSPGIITSSLQVVTPPQFGTATPDAIGRILYHHTSGAPSTDSFTYRAVSSGGTSTPTTVTIDFSNSLRIPNPQVNVPENPPVTSIELVPAFDSVSFNQPIMIAHPPAATNQLFVVERRNGIRVIPDLSNPVPNATLFLDMNAHLSAQSETLGNGVDRGVMSLAFHPGYATNRQFFVFYSVIDNGLDYFRVSRFTTSVADPFVVDTNSESILIQQRDQNGFHLGTDMHFGPDRYLYIATGDGGGQNDSRGNGQVIDRDFFSAILRIDVDKRPGNLEPNPHASVPLDGGLARYAIPADNPFVTDQPTLSYNGNTLAANTVRTEFFANGLRNPWKFSFDSATGDLWCGDVGQNAREEINIITNGGNYGWAYREGSLNGPRVGEQPVGFSPTPPLYEYSLGNGELQGFSVTGGLVYRGTNVQSLTGDYIFGDYVSGNIWALDRSGSTVNVTRITGEAGITAFGTDPSNGDLLAVDYGGSRILRLVNGSTDTGDFPTLLSETGLFADLSDLSPAPGLLPYEPNLAFWSDYAIKRRWFMIPDATNQVTWQAEDAWGYPDGMIWVKHFDLEAERGNTNTLHRIETRLLVKNQTGAYGVSYRWNTNQTDAVLVGDAGITFSTNIVVNGSNYIQQVRIPSRAECLACHTPQAGHALSFNTRQLNRTADLHGFSGNQIDLLGDGGYLLNPPDNANALPRHVRPDETNFSIEARVRSYLDTNCANCHRNGGTATESWDARAQLSLAETGVLNGTASNNGGDPANRLVVPGDLQRSIILNRVAATNGFTRMPQLGSHELDHQSIALLTEWITQVLPSQLTYTEWRQLHFSSTSSPAGLPEADPDGDQRSNREEFLTATNPNDPDSYFQPMLMLQAPSVTMHANVPDNRSLLIEQSTDLQHWSRWDATNNHGLPLSGGTTTFEGPDVFPRQFFRLQIREH